MRLAKLTVCGFKSFADETVFTFDDAITGIVGPNGCGKSNVVDAIKWVLGERSSKSLRGKEMLDVVFAGSASRAPSGLAWVRLTFENPEEGDSEARRHEGGEEQGAQVGDGEETGSPTVREGSAPVGSPTIREGLASSSAHAPETRHGVAGHPGSLTAAPGRQHLLDDEDTDSESGLIDRAANVRRGLPIDADVVEVERRLHRDGTSHYLINGRKARLKDIRDLFLDTGIGADAYSIIEQGKVDAMLLASPMERRTIFEEAAGIAKYKQRRIEASRKLEKAEANLALTREQLATTERRLRIVKGQAAKARKWVDLDIQLKSARMALAFDQYDELVSRLETLDARSAEIESLRATAGEALTLAEAAKQEAELSRHESLSRLRAIEQDRTSAQHTADSARQRVELVERALEETRRQGEKDTARAGELARRASDLSQRLASLVARAEEISTEVIESQRRLDDVATQRAGALEDIAVARAHLTERRDAAAGIDRDRSALLASIEAEQRRRASLEDQVSRASERASALAGEYEGVARAVADGETAMAQRTSRIAELETQLSRDDEADAALAHDRRAVSDRLADLEQRHLRLEGRRGTLEEMVASRVGLGEAARDVLERHARGKGFAGVIAPLADLIEADSQHAPAVEAALGPAMQALAVASSMAMPSSDELATLGGRVMFVPLAGGGEVIPGEGPEARLPDAVRRLRPLVRASGSLDAATAMLVERVLDRWLTSTFVVDSLDGAMLLAAGPLSGCRLVTSDGAVVEGDGRVLAGPMVDASGEPAGMLQRRTELESIRGDVALLEAAMSQESSLLASVDGRAEEIANRRRDARTQIAAEQRTLAAETARVEHQRHQLGRVAQDMTHIESERQRLAALSARLDGDVTALVERAERLGRLHEEMSAAAEAAQRDVANKQTQVEQATEQLTAARIETSRLGEAAAALAREQRQVETDLADVERERRAAAHQIEELDRRVQAHVEAIAAARAEIESSRVRAESLADEAAKERAKGHEFEEACRACGEGVVAARSRLNEIEGDAREVEFARREAQVKRESLEERCREDLSLDLAWEHAEYRAMMAGGDVARIVPAEAQPEIETLRDEIRRLGNVNLQAIDEESQLESRNETLIAQVADIDTARVKLEELITALNEASRTRFAEVFAAIQEHFSSPSGMFRRLFGGGRAEVRLMPLIKEVEGPEGTRKVETDEIDLLESGIEVVAKPPGKEPRAISQLSGGEKTLTAVALLLSIFRSKPSCFCILDEVDAALDDANVGRFCDVIRAFTTHSHFIVITHNKKTMQAADRLFGVTMQEKGVSKRVSVRFEQVEHDDAPTRRKAEVVADSVAPDADDFAEGETASNGGRALLRRALAGMREKAAD